MTVSRRTLMGGLSLLPLAAGLTGCAARALGSPLSASDSEGPVGPGANWNGDPLSGGLPPADPPRLTAKPAIHWLIPSELRMVNSLVIGVDADGKGGVKQVDFWVEGNVRSVTIPTIFQDTDVNGSPRSRYGYWITLDAAKFRAVSETGGARIFATAIPNYASMQNRVIGFTSGDAATDQLRGDYAMTVYPRAVANDWSKTVGPAGADFPTLDAAIRAARAVAAEAPLITFTQTGSYELISYPGVSNNYGGGKGFCTLRAAPGVIATLGRAAPFIPNNPSSWTWTPGWDGMEFRGSGIVFDQRNWSTIVFSAKAAWFNGCRFTNSEGTLYSYYWNGGSHPGCGANGNNYWNDVVMTYVTGTGTGDQRYVQNVSIHQYASDAFSGTNYVCGTYLHVFDAEPFVGTYQGSKNYTALRINGPANATVTKTAGDVAGGSLVLRVSGSTVATIPLGFYGSDINPTINDVVTAINAVPGWTASAPTLSPAMTPANRGGMRPSAIGTPTSHSSPFNDLVASVTLNLNAGIDLHVDWWQGYCASNTRENVIIRNNVVRGANLVNSILNNDDASNGGRSQDHIVKGNVWLGTSNPSASGGSAPAPGPNSMSHMVFENNTHEPGIMRVVTAAGDLAYSSFRCNIVGQMYTSNNTATWNVDTPWTDNFYTPSFVGAMSATPNTGNVQYTNFSALFVDYSAGDLRPAPGGALPSKLAAKINLFDGTGAPFATADVVGARAKAAPAPVYPF